MLCRRLPNWAILLATGSAPLAGITACDLGAGGGRVIFSGLGADALGVVFVDDAYGPYCCRSDEVIVIYDDYWYDDGVFVEEIYVVEEEIIFDDLYYDDWYW